MYLYFKRTFDLIVSIVLLIILIPVFIVIAIAIKLDSKGPVIYKQSRSGRDMKPFTMYKFRTMQVNTPCVANHLFTNMESYITKSGLILRKTSMDELPQIFNIFWGDMSFIGPRPVIMSETDVLEARVACGASLIRPGLTGWAQVNGRDDLTPDEKVRFDADYVKKISLLFDCKILVKTVFVVLKKEGYREGGER